MGGTLKQWELFEEESCQYIKKMLRGKAAVSCQGKGDSTTSDIKVTTKSGHTFFIESKQCPSQAGQFVVVPNLEERAFEFSRKNKTSFNKESAQILRNISRDFDRFYRAGTKGEPVNIDEETMYNWVESHYKSLFVEFFITNNFAVSSIADIRKTFQVTATCRAKRSGSRPVPKKSFTKVLDFLKSELGGVRIDVLSDYLIWMPEIQPKTKTFELEDERYYLSPFGSGYKVKKLSKTNSLSIVFSLGLNPDSEDNLSGLLRYVSSSS